MGPDFRGSTITGKAAQQQVRQIVADVADSGSRPGDLTPAGSARGVNLSKQRPQGLAAVPDARVVILGDLAYGYISPVAAVSVAAASPVSWVSW